MHKENYVRLYIGMCMCVYVPVNEEWMPKLVYSYETIYIISFTITIDYVIHTHTHAYMRAVRDD